jgi:hypothetical protein
MRRTSPHGPGFYHAAESSVKRRLGKETKIDTLPKRLLACGASAVAGDFSAIINTIFKISGRKYGSDPRQRGP